MSEPDDFRARASDIFEKLRAGIQQGDEEPNGGGSTSAPGSEGSNSPPDAPVPAPEDVHRESVRPEPRPGDVGTESSIGAAPPAGEAPGWAGSVEAAVSAPGPATHPDPLPAPMNWPGGEDGPGVAADPPPPGAPDGPTGSAGPAAPTLNESAGLAGSASPAATTIDQSGPAASVLPPAPPRGEHAGPAATATRTAVDGGPQLHPGPASRRLPRRLAVANQKGGVGKTTTAVNLGAALAELGYRVLVVDLDPQGNATTGLGINARNLDASVYDVILHDVPVEDVIEPTSLRNLFVVPATIDLAGAEIELVPVFSRELRLKRALEPAEGDFDFTLIDCPPSLGLLTVNGLAAAGEVVVPIQCEYYALEGLGQLLRNVGLVQANLNAQLEVTTIILTMFDARTKLAEQVADEVRQHFGERVCRNVVPRTVRLSEAPSFGQPIIIFDPSSRGSLAYRELAKEVSGGAPQRVG